jgi:hypothetical protein
MKGTHIPIAQRRGINVLDVEKALKPVVLTHTHVLSMGGASPNPPPISNRPLPSVNMDMVSVERLESVQHQWN